MHSLFNQLKSSPWGQVRVNWLSQLFVLLVHFFARPKKRTKKIQPVSLGPLDYFALGSLFSSNTVHLSFIVFVSCLIFTNESIEAADKTAYLRIGAGVSLPTDTVFSDPDCQSTSPAALFGCANGNDGRATGAYGDFGNSGILDMGFGYHWNEWLRTEILLSYRPGFEFDGTSNFNQVSTSFAQTVDADVTSLSGMIVGIVRPLALFQVEKQKIEPFLFGGLGGAYNHIDSMRYTFPATATITPDGSHSGFAWTVGAGLSYGLTEKIELELAYRYSDLGKVTTDTGTMTILRRSTNSVINNSIVINETEADLEVNEVVLGVIWHF